MGEYARTHEMIASLKAEKAKKLKHIARLEAKIERLRGDISEINLEIGECEGYLLELDWLDNH